MRAQQRPAGVPDDLSPDELERWSNDLVAFLTSERVPAGFRGWANAQAAQLDAYLAAADDLDEDARTRDASDDDDDGAEIAPPAAPPQRARRNNVPPRATAQSARPPGVLVLQVPERAGKLLIGIAIGIVVVIGVVLVRNGGGNGSAAPLPDSSSAATFDQARADELTQIVQQDPSNKDALFELGEMNFQAARNQDAIAWFTKLVALDPANVHAMRDIGTANFNLGNPDEAKVWWQKALAVDPNDVQSHYNMGFAWANAEPRDLAAAVSEWETVIRLDPSSQLAETARVHVEGLKARLTATPAAAGRAQDSATPVAAP